MVNKMLYLSFTMSQLKYNFDLLKEHKQLCHIWVARCTLGEVSSLSKLGGAEELLIWSIGSDNCVERFTFLAGMTVQLLKMFYLGTIWDRINPPFLFVVKIS